MSEICAIYSEHYKLKENKTKISFMENLDEVNNKIHQSAALWKMCKQSINLQLRSFISTVSGRRPTILF